MPLPYDILYSFALPPAIPILALKSRRTGKYRTDLPARFGFGPDAFPKRLPHQKLLLLHCVSVGELLSIQTLLDKLLAADPHLLIALTTTTDTATTRAHSLYPQPQTLDPRPQTPPPPSRIHTTRFPFDFSFAVESLFDRLRPDAVALVELETWPNFLAIAKSRRIPVALVNGRLSEKSFPRYNLIRPLMKSMLQKLSFLGIQTQTIANRFLALGAPPQKIQILPTLKYDNANFTLPVPGQEALAQSIGLSPTHQLLVAGSTAPGEELPLLTTYLTLQKSHPTLRLAIAPRKPESLPPLLDALKNANLTPILRTHRPDSLATDHSPLATNQIFLLDTLGELKKLYALASFTFIGRSLVNLGGSDMIESAALAKPTCFGPHTQNFSETVELLLQENAAIEVQNTAELTQTLKNWLENPQAAHELGQRAKNILAAQRGSTDIYIQKLLHLLHPHRTAKAPLTNAATPQSPPTPASHTQ